MRKGIAGPAPWCSASYARDGASVEYRAINSCIRFLATLDGKELVTVAARFVRRMATLHPVQRAMVGSARIPVRLLHAGFRDEPVRAVP